MTTIAFDGKYIAADGRETFGSIVASDTVDKFYKKGDIVYCLAGAVDECIRFVADFKEKESFFFEKSDCCGFMVDAGIVYYVCIFDGLFYKCPQGRDKFALGSGMQFAIAAMDHNCDALSAITYTAKRDTKTGGDITIYEVETGNFSVITKYE